MKNFVLLVLLFFPISIRAEEQKPASSATIYFYRPHRFEGAALKPPLFVDDTEIGSIHNGDAIEVVVWPGLHRVYSNDKSTGIELDAKYGQTYFVRVDIKTGAWKGHGAVTLVDPQEGKYELSRQKISTTKNLATGQAPPSGEGNHQLAVTPSGVTDTNGVTRRENGPATIFVSSTPDGADVFADGAFVGNSPVTLRLDAGKHTIRVSKAEYKDWSRDITVQVGAESRLLANLEKQ